MDYAKVVVLSLMAALALAMAVGESYEPAAVGALTIWLIACSVVTLAALGTVLWYIVFAIDRLLHLIARLVRACGYN